MKNLFTQRIFVFHNHLSQQSGSKTMGLDGTIAIDSVQKSDFDLIPDETRTRASKHSRRIPEPADMQGGDRLRKTAAVPKIRLRHCGPNVPHRRLLIIFLWFKIIFRI